MPGILVVEDDENLNRGITFSLKKVQECTEVFSAESVKKAKRIASDNNVDVTICDVNLPDGNGLEFVRWMRCNYNTYIICLIINRIYRNLLTTPAVYWEESKDADSIYIRNQRPALESNLKKCLLGNLHIHKNSAFLGFDDEGLLGEIHPKRRGTL